MYKVNYEMGDYPMVPISEYEDQYAVDTQGTIWNTKFNRPLTPSVNKITGYCRVNLNKDGKSRTFYVHRVVATHLLPAIAGLDEIDHINRNKLDNRVENLQWITHAENCAKNRGRTANCKKVRCIETQEVFNSIAEAARVIGRKQCSLVSCLHGRSRTCGGYHWEYVEDLYIWSNGKSDEENIQNLVRMD